MKRLRAVLLFVGAVALATAPLRAADPNCPTDQSKPCVTFFDGQTTSQTSQIIDLSGYSRISVRISCVANCPATATVNMLQRNTPDENFSDPVILWTNPTATQQGYNIGTVGQIEFVMSISGGTIQGTVVRVK